MNTGQLECMRGVVADKAIAVIEQYRGGRFHGREVSCILAEMFEAANDSFERMMLLHGEKPKGQSGGTGREEREEKPRCVESDFIDGTRFGIYFLFGASVARVDGFRSQPTVNTDDDMVRVVLDMPKPSWWKLRGILPPNKEMMESDEVKDE